MARQRQKSIADISRQMSRISELSGNQVSVSRRKGQVVDTRPERVQKADATARRYLYNIIQSPEYRQRMKIGYVRFDDGRMDKYPASVYRGLSKG